MVTSALIITVNTRRANPRSNSILGKALYNNAIERLLLWDSVDCVEYILMLVLILSLSISILSNWPKMCLT